VNGPWLDTPAGVVWAVIHLPGRRGNGAITHITADSGDADMYARTVRGVIVALPVVADYRTDPPTAQGEPS
jgi:hypothetical protein